MPKQLKLLSCLLFSLFLLASIGLAQERGSVRGLVKSDAGQALENATVVISGPYGERVLNRKRRELYLPGSASR
jgi:hypothetical protein